MKIPLLVGAALIASTARAADSSASSQPPVLLPQVEVTEAKTHTLFMGADIGINLDRDLYPVRNVIGSDWVIVINNENHEISSKRGAVDLRITPKLKLAEGEATISGFNRQAAYSWANDPSVRLTVGLTNAGTLNQTLIGVQRDAQAKQDTVGNNALGAAALYATADNQFGEAALMATLATLSGGHHLAGTSDGAAYTGGRGWSFVRGSDDIVAGHAGSDGASATEPTGRIATQGLDAMDVDFSIASPKPLSEPYVVTMTRFHPAGAKPGVVQNLVYARALDRIGPLMTHVHFSEEGFPFNYELLDFQLHLYDHGIEVATNISDKHVELTRSEAFEYIKMEYLGAHRTETLEAEPALGRFPAQLPVYLHQGKYAQTFFVRVTKEGTPMAAYADAACTQKIDDAFLETVVQGIWFKPALAHGQPVDGVAPVNLAKLTI